MEDLLDAESGPERVPDEENTLGIGGAELSGDQVLGQDFPITIAVGANAPGFAIAAEAAAADF